MAVEKKVSSVNHSDTKPGALLTHTEYLAPMPDNTKNYNQKLAPMGGRVKGTIKSPKSK